MAQAQPKNTSPPPPPPAGEKPRPLSAAEKRSLAVKQEIKSVAAVLQQMKAQMELALPKHLTADRLVRVALTAITTTPKLLTCDRNTLYRALMDCAQLGLEPNGVLGQAFLVPFNSPRGPIVQFIPGYKGYKTLAYNSGQVRSMSSREVRKADHFVYELGLNEKCEHIPAAGSPADRGPITHFYFVAQFTNGGHHLEVMTVDEVNAVRNDSEGYKAFKANRIKSTPWDPEGSPRYVQMGKKTVVRRAAASGDLPMSVQRLAIIDSAVDAGRAVHMDLELGELVIDEEPTAAAPEASRDGEQAAEPGAAEGAADAGAAEPQTGSQQALEGFAKVGGQP